MTAPPRIRRRPTPVGVAPSLRRWYDRAFTWDQAPRAHHAQRFRLNEPPASR